MVLLEKILNTLPEEPVPVRKVIVGVHWTMVCSQSCGLASSLVNEGPHGHAPIRDVGGLHLKSAQELAGWLLSDNWLEASIGMAAVNSLLEYDEKRTRQINAAEVIERESRGKNLVVVGHFPFVERIQPSTASCRVIEKRPASGDFPEEAAPDYIPRADVVAITATAFINHTVEGLLALCRPDALVMVLGPSTPFAPLLFDEGVSILSGAHVEDEEAAALTILQGAAFPQVKGTRLWSITRN